MAFTARPNQPISSLPRKAVQPRSSAIQAPSRQPSVTQLAVAALLAATVVVCPLPMGCAGEWGRLALEGAMTVAVVLWALAQGSSRLAVGLPLAIASLVFLQLVPLPDSVLLSIAPVSGGSWKAAHEMNPGKWGTISIDPAATAAAGRRLLLGLATVAAVADLSRFPRSRRWLLGGVSAAGVLILALGFLFPFDREGRTFLGFVDMKGPVEFWRTSVQTPAETAGWGYLEWVTLGDKRYLTELRVIGDAYGSYATSNQFAGGVYLTLPVCLAAMLFLGRGRAPTGAVPAAAIAILGIAIWFVGGVAKSRAGGACLLMGGLALLALVAPREKFRRAAGVVTLGYAICILLFTSLFLGDFQSLMDIVPAPVRTRLFAATDDGRAIASRAAVRMALASPLIGTGLSTYGDLYARVVGGKHVWYYAHNDYAQLLAETGLVGLAVAASLAFVLVSRFRRFVTLPDSAMKIWDAGPWASMAALLVHSLFDWNMHVPANAFLAAVVAGLCLGSVPRPAGPPSSVADRPAPTWLRVGLAAACMGAFGLLARDACSDSAARKLRLATEISQPGPRDRRASPPRSPPPIDVAIEAAERMAALDPWNSRLSLALGQGFMHVEAQQKTALAEAGVVTSSEESLAERWFRRAQSNRAVCRGLAEPTPPPTPAPARR